MKKLTRILALVMVLAMTLSLCAFGANYDKYTDAAAAEASPYSEAIDVVVGLGIINGTTDTTLGLDGTLTRAQAAKILTYLTAGEAVAKAVNSSTTDTGFTDCAGNWASGYIAYCVAKGYLAGVGDGKFDPNGALTGYAFEKMLLNTLGYGLKETASLVGTAIVAGVENAYVGANWAINVAVDAEKAGLTKGIEGVDYGKAITREVAMQLVFNTLKNWQAAKTGDATKAHYALVPAYQIISDIAAGSADPFGAPVNAWFVNSTGDGTTKDVDKNGKIIEVATAPATPVASFTAYATEADVFAAVGAEGKVGTSGRYIVETGYYWDGYYYSSSSNIEKGDKTSAWNWNGVKLDVYATGTPNQYLFVYVGQYFSTVSAVTKADPVAETKRTITVDGMTFETEDFAKGDAVIYTYVYVDGGANDYIVSVEAPAVIEGATTKVTSAGVYTIGGKDYELDDNFPSGDEPAIKPGAPVESWYLDSYGYIIAPKSAAPAAKDWKYGILINYAANAGTAANLLNPATAPAEKFQLFTAEGETVVLDGAFKTKPDGTVDAFVGPGTNANDINELVRYTVNPDGKVTAIEETASGTGAWTSTPATATKGNAKFDGKYVNSNTVFFVYQAASGPAPAAYAVFVGYNNLPASGYTGGYDAFYAVKPDNSADTTTFAAAMISANVSTQTAKTYVYFASDASAAETTAQGTIYTYTDAYVDGVKTELKFDATTVPSSSVEGNLYEYTADSKSGIVTLGTKLNGTDVKVTAVADTYFVAGSDFYFGANTKFYEITPAGVEAATAIPASNPDFNTMLVYAPAGTSPVAPATVVFFTVVPV